MKRLLAVILVLSAGSAAAAAPEATTVAGVNAGRAGTVEHYDYSQQLDVHKVLSISNVAERVCGPVPATMVYQDSQGKVHQLEYTVMGEGCLYN